MIAARITEAIARFKTIHGMNPNALLMTKWDWVKLMNELKPWTQAGRREIDLLEPTYQHLPVIFTFTGPIRPARLSPE